MKLSSWPISLAGLLFLIFSFISSPAQIDSLAGDPIHVARDINKWVVPIPLNDKVNTNYVETGPLVSSSGKRLYYSRYGHPLNTGGTDDTDIWYNEFNDSTHSWDESTNIGAPLNNSGPNFVFEVGWTDDSLLVANRYDKKGRMKAGLSFSVWNGKTWSIPAPIQVKKDYNLAENVGYDLSPYRNVLLIAEEKVDSHGKTDLYVAFRDHSKAQTTTEKLNLGEVINSPGSERSPFLTDDTRTLYFASDGHNGYGKLDIFRSHRMDDTWTNWSKPENLGPGINTPYDDRSFSFASISRYAYYARGINSARTDIYRVAMSELFETVITAIKDLMEGSTPAEAGQTFTVKNAFPGERAELTDSAKSELGHVVVYMQRHKNLVLFLSTHSTLHANRNQSLTLSDQRMEAVKQYLVANGIDKNRLQGESDGHDVAKVDPRKYLPNSIELKFINKVIIRDAPSQDK